MGWLFGHTSKADLIKSIDIEHKHTVGSHLWGIYKGSIILFLLSKQGDKWGYKEIDEDMGPYHYDCPLSVLDRADPPRSEYATQWREKVRGFHAKKPQAGQLVKYGSRIYKLVCPAGPRLGWTVEGPDGNLFRMKSTQLKEAEPC